MRTLVGGLFLVGVLGVAGADVLAQIELDRILSRVDGSIVMQSDVRRARMLQLVDASLPDEAVVRALENRLLILKELERASPLDPPDRQALADRRSEWQSAQGDPQRAQQALRQSGMTDAELDAWLRDDLRIRAYLGRQFGMLGAAERDRAEREWIARLRQRADLPQ